MRGKQMRRVMLIVLGLALSLPGVAQDTNGLFEAIRKNDLTAIGSAKGEALNAPGRMGLTPLMYAAAFGSLEAIQLLLEHGAAVMAKDPREATSLHYGAWAVARSRMLIAKRSEAIAGVQTGMTYLLATPSCPEQDVGS